MKKSPPVTRMQILLFCITIFLLIFSCKNSDKKEIVSAATETSYSPPVSFLLDTMPPPKITELKKVPPPQIINSKPPVVTEVTLPLAHFTNFNTEQGLALNGVLDEVKDSKGRLWFGTGGGGVSCYDGLKFTNFTTEQGFNFTTNCMTADKNGDLWFSGYGEGIYNYNGSRVTKYTTEQGLADNTVFDLTVDRNGNLWCATLRGVSRFDDQRFTTIDTSNGLPVNNVNSIEEDSKGNIWFITFGGGVCRYDGKVIKTFTTDDGLPTNYMISFFEDSKGQYWFGSYEKGACIYDKKNFIPINIGQQHSQSTISEIEEDDRGNIWFATSGHGVVRFDGIKFSSFTTEQGLANDGVRSITKDDHGNLWFATFGGGLSRYNGGAFNMLTPKHGLPQVYIRNIAEDEKGDLWLSTDGSGIIRYDGKYFTSYTIEQGLVNNTVECSFEDQSGIIWIGTQGGLSQFDGNSFTNYTTAQGFADDGVYDILQDRNGDMWFGTYGGLTRYDGKRLTTYTTQQGLANNIITCMHKDRNEIIWIGTQDGGVSRYDGKQFLNFTTKQGLPHNKILDIKEDRSGNLWFCTSGGVGRYDGHNILKFGAEQGLPENLVCNFAEDKQGVIWLGSYHGFSSLKFKIPPHDSKPEEIKGAGFFNVTNNELKKYEPVIEVFNEETGYPLKDMIDEAMLIKRKNFRKGSDRDSGIIWAPGGDVKLFRFDSKLLKKSLKAPNVFIRSLKIDENIINWYRLGTKAKDSIQIAQQDAMVYGKLLNANDVDSLQKSFSDIQYDSITSFYQLPQNLVLPYKHNRVSFDFGAVETSRNFMVRYQYILEGYDKEWGPATEKTSATYGNIPEGTHTFKLKARSPEGVWSEPISYSFKVLPPWWRTWWFRTIEGISILILLYGIYRWRTAALRKQKRVLEKTVKERTAEVVKQKEKSEELLLNILPSEVADELKEKGYTTAKSFDEVTVLFSDIKGFTNVAEKMTAQELVKEINTYFSAFDVIIQKYGLEKIKTIGDAYIAAGGLPEKNSATAQNVVEAAISMQKTIQELKQERISLNKPYFELRIGIHTGPVVAGVVGIKKFQYDIWGDTVNLAARMEQSGIPGKINISQHTYELVKEQFDCVHRGKIEAKNKGGIDMYFVDINN